MTRFRIALLTLPLCSALTMAAPAQPAPPAQEAPRLLFDPAQLPVFHGKVAQYTLTPRGGVDGLILDDGSQVHVGRRLSTQLAATIRPGDAVTIHGVKATSGGLILAVSIANDTGGATLVNEGMQRRMEGPPLVAQGKIKTVLHNERDEIDGVLLEDGSQIRLWPMMARRMSAQLSPGQPIYASGFGQDSVLGKVVTPQRIGASETEAAELRAPMFSRRFRPEGDDDRGEREHRRPGPPNGPPDAPQQRP